MSEEIDWTQVGALSYGAHLTIPGEIIKEIYSDGSKLGDVIGDSEGYYRVRPDSTGKFRAIRETAEFTFHKIKVLNTLLKLFKDEEFMTDKAEDLLCSKGVDVLMATLQVSELKEDEEEWAALSEEVVTREKKKLEDSNYPEFTGERFVEVTYTVDVEQSKIDFTNSLKLVGCEDE